ncbi:MAG: hypothetical protein OEZ01_05445, partial [Candidatus Heimdallarchaeota archaeon]|nr:hypothetical protein [Candidatus Heimdallarchaeota archaeon]
MEVVPNWNVKLKAEQRLRDVKFDLGYPKIENNRIISFKIFITKGMKVRFDLVSFQHLEQLFISGESNNPEYVMLSTLSSLSNLKSLSYGFYDELPKPFVHIPGLQELHLRRMNNKKLYGLLSVEDQDKLTNEQYKEVNETGSYTNPPPEKLDLDRSIGNLIDLECLIFEENHLTSIPEEIGKLAKLKILKLRKNRLTNLPQSVVKLINLEKLDLSHNQLTNIPDDIVNFIKLKDFILEDNELTHLPEDIGKL